MKTELIVADYTMPIIHTMDRLFEHHGQNSQLEFRAIVSTSAGVSIVDFRDFENEKFTTNPSSILNYFKKGALQTVQARVIGQDYWVTIFKRKGKKITLVDAQVLRDLKVGTVNQLWYNTNLYNQHQYSAVNSKTWDSYVFRQNAELAQAV